MPASSVLLLCDDRPSHAPNVLEHIRAFPRYSRHSFDLFNPRGITRSRFLRLDDYDVVVVHYTVPVYLSEWFEEWIAEFAGLKIQFLQDEYRRVDAMSAQMRELGIDVLFSSVPADAVPDVYGSRLPGVDIVPTLTGYVPADLDGRALERLAGRPLDVVYRGRSIPYWLGRLGQDKSLIGREFLARAGSTGLRCDIAWTEADRIYGDDWYRFLGSSRSTLGTESGASIVDFDGSLQQRTDDYIAANPGATFEEVEREILWPFEGNAVIEAVSPRVFEAAALGTAMVNFRGRYSDVIEPWVHYVPLEKDFSNFDEVLSAIEDGAVMEKLAARAHEDLVASGRYSLKTFVEGFDREIDARVGPSDRRRRPRAAAKLNRSLRSLEHVRSASRVAEHPFVAARRTRAARRALGRIVGRFPEIESLGRAEPDLARREKLQHDLDRLAVATAAHLRELRYFGRPFDVRLALGDNDRKLTLVGTREPGESATERRDVGDRVASAIRQGRLEEIVWNNSAIGGLTFMTVPIASLDIGYHITGSTHRFTALLELARRDPEAVVSALEPLFRPRPDVPVHELHGPVGILFRFRSSPGRAATRGAAALRAVLTSTELRPLLRAYLRSPDARAEAPPDLVLEDLFKLSLISQTQVSVELDSGTLIYRTDTADANGGLRLDADAVRTLDGIVWDNTAGASPVTSKTRPRVSLELDGGRHDFPALTLIARRFPALAAPALRRAAGERGQSDIVGRAVSEGRRG
jgi:hypothetical protein